MKTELSGWIIVDGYCATRIIKGTDVNHVKNRVAFIEKWGRIRVAPYTNMDTDSKNWKFIHKGRGGNGDLKKNECYGYDLETRSELDTKLSKMGYVLN